MTKLADEASSERMGTQDTGIQERRLAAIMFTDLVGYTRLAQSNEKVALDLLERHRQSIRPLFSKHGGKEVKTMGDAFLIEFQSALEAVDCAVEMQEIVHNYNSASPPEKRTQLKIGIHVGDVVHRDGDIYGDAVNIASRIEPLAEQGGICISEQVFDQVRNKTTHPLQKLGAKELKNVRYPVEIYRLTLPWEVQSVGEARPLEKRRLAVLPLVNMTSDSNDAYFADGMTEELISTISNIGGLTVISRTSAMRYKGADKSIGDIGAELGAGSILEGSVRKAGNRVRITVQLIDASEDKHLWAQNYDRDLEDIFAVQSDIARSVADSLKVQLVGREESQLEKKPTENIEAYTLYLKGRQYWNARSPDSLKKALEYFNLATNKDPSFALAYVGTADAHSVLVDHGYEEPAEGHKKSKDAAEKALSLDGALAEAHASLGSVLSAKDHDWRGSEREFKRAIELNPNYASAHQWYSILLRMEGRFEEALSEAKKALECDPMSPIMQMNVGDRLYTLRKFDEAQEYLEKALDIEQDFIPALDALWFLYSYKSMHQKALDTIERLRILKIGEARVELRRAYVAAMAGRKDEAIKILEATMSGGLRGEAPPLEVAWIYALVGDPDRTFEWLGRAYERGGTDLLYIKGDVTFDGLRSDPRYTELLGKVGLMK